MLFFVQKIKGGNCRPQYIEHSDYLVTLTKLNYRRAPARQRHTRLLYGQAYLLGGYLDLKTLADRHLQQIAHNARRKPRCVAV